MKATHLVLALAPLFASVSGAQELEPYVPPEMNRDALERALDADLGSGLSGALPEALLHAIVVLEPERFGDGVDEAYRRYGFLRLRGRETPVGIVAVRRLGVRAHQFNCLVCHAGRGRGADERDLLVVGATNHTVRFSGWYRDVYGGLRRLVRREVEALGADAPRARLEARVATRLVRAAREGLARAGSCLYPTEMVSLAIMARTAVETELDSPRPDTPDPYGPGRNVVQQPYRVFRFKLDPGPFAPVKPPDLFGVRYRESLLWTGNETFEPGTSAGERIGRNGMLVPWIQLHPLTREPIPDVLTFLRFRRYLRMGELLASSAPPPARAPESESERAALRRGQVVFEKTCTKCHGRYRFEERPTPAGRPGLLAFPVDYPEKIVQPRVVGTDSTYALANDRDFLEAFEGSFLGRARLFNGRVTGGYVARPLLGLRLRAPFLHNGSVPSLRWMLTPPESRPGSFRVGDGVPDDPESVGLRHPLNGDGGGPVRTTDGPGDRSIGHTFGTRLSPQDKRDLLAYLRRL